ncbi:hypothetical protein DFQ29_010045 [Apophysomyces sp. BC1021]|nr:hypothetical protein DFQ29_010045 [Apophysomyces sp. BC1021]
MWTEKGDRSILEKRDLGRWDEFKTKNKHWKARCGGDPAEDNSHTFAVQPDFANQKTTLHKAVISEISLTSQDLLSDWQSFTTYARGIRPKREMVFKDKVAKMTMNQRRIERIWVRSNEANSAAFDIAASSATSPSDFLRALTSAYPEAVGTIPSKHRF